MCSSCPSLPLIFAHNGQSLMVSASETPSKFTELSEAKALRVAIAKALFTDNVGISSTAKFFGGPQTHIIYLGGDHATPLQIGPAPTVPSTANAFNRAKALHADWTHTQYLTECARVVLAWASSQPTANLERLSTLAEVSVQFGVSIHGVRGLTAYAAWVSPSGSKVPSLTINSMACESLTQVWGTLIHELGHALAGPGVGHSPAWLKVCAELGLGGPDRMPILAAGTNYAADMFACDLFRLLQTVRLPNDGGPISTLQQGNSAHWKPSKRNGACSAGYGTRGGTSRGPGSGSSLRLYHCACTPPQKIRASTDTLDCRCNKCLTNFQRQP